MNGIGHQFGQALSLIVHDHGYLRHLLVVTAKVAAISTGAAILIGLPIALVLALARFRGRRALLILANAGLGLPPVVVGTFVLLLTIPRSVLDALPLAETLTGVYVAQAILAIPYVVVLSASALQSLPAGVLAQARALGASRGQLARLALSEARVGIVAAIIAALGVVISEVGAVVIIGGNVEGYDQTLASALLAQFNLFSNDAEAMAIGIVLLIVILLLTGALTLLQHRERGLRSRPATT